MIKIGDTVTVSPAHSLKFAGWKGEVIDIKPEDGFPIKIKFKENSNLNKFVFGFSPEELVKEDTDGESN